MSENGHAPQVPAPRTSTAGEAEGLTREAVFTDGYYARRIAAGDRPPNTPEAVRPTRLEPCRWCDPKSTTNIPHLYELPPDKGPRKWAVMCLGCCATGPSGFSPEDARTFWNRRPSGWQPIESAPKALELLAASSDEYWQSIVFEVEAGAKGCRSVLLTNHQAAHLMAWARIARDSTLAGHPWLPCPICNGVEGCDHTLPERASAARKQAAGDAGLPEVKASTENGRG